MGTKLHQVMIEHLENYVRNDVFCPICKKSILVTEPNKNVTVSECFNYWDRLLFFHKQKKIIDSIEKKVTINDYSCLHAYTLFTDGNAAFELSKKYDVPFVVAVRATDIEFFDYRINLRQRGIRIMENASKIFFLSETIRNKFINNYVPKKKWKNIFSKSVIIPNGINDFWLDNTYKRKNFNQKSNKLNICCVAQIIKRKNIPVLQNAVRMMNENGWNIRISVIGKIIDRNEFDRVRRDEYTDYYEPVNQQKLIDFYRNSDLFVLPSKGETFGLVYAEAMSQGLPVIYSKNEGFDSQFEDGLIGYSVQSNKPKEIVAAIERIIEKYDDISQNCITYCEMFRWEKLVRRYVDIYEELCLK